MKEFFGKMFNAENKTKSIGIICGVVAAIIVIILLIVFNPFASKNAKIQKNLEARLTELGKDFYKNYYNQGGKDEEARKEFVKKYTSTGLKIDLANLARTKANETDSILAEFKNADGEACNTTTTKVTIYPKEPYGENDYTIEVKLECNFDKKGTTTTKKASSENTSNETTTTTTTTTTTKKKK